MIIVAGTQPSPIGTKLFCKKKKKNLGAPYPLPSSILHLLLETEPTLCSRITPPSTSCLLLFCLVMIGNVSSLLYLYHKYSNLACCIGILYNEFSPEYWIFLHNLIDLWIYLILFSFFLNNYLLVSFLVFTIRSLCNVVDCFLIGIQLSTFPGPWCVTKKQFRQKPRLSLIWWLLWSNIYFLNKVNYCAPSYTRWEQLEWIICIAAILCMHK